MLAAGIDYNRSGPSRSLFASWRLMGRLPAHGSLEKPKSRVCPAQQQRWLARQILIKRVFLNFLLWGITPFRKPALRREGTDLVVGTTSAGPSGKRSRAAF